MTRNTLLSFLFMFVIKIALQKPNHVEIPYFLFYYLDGNYPNKLL